MREILELTDQTADQYELMYLGAYWRWCESVSITNAETQMVLSNAAVNKYYNREYAKCEKEFLFLIKNYSGSIGPEDARQLYNRCTYEMFNRRCMPTINQAKKNNICNNEKT